MDHTIESLASVHKQLEVARDEQEFINNALAKLDDLKDEKERMKAQRRLEEMQEQNANWIDRIIEQKKRLQDIQPSKLRVIESVENVESAAMNERHYNKK